MKGFKGIKFSSFIAQRKINMSVLGKQEKSGKCINKHTKYLRGVDLGLSVISEAGYNL